jgi:protein-tyrosine phosphatase
MVIKHFNFGPASQNERIVHGSQKPGFSQQAIEEWAQFMLDGGIKRVCCLLDPSQLRSYSSDLGSAYERHFGKGNICMAPITDYHLCEASALHGQILPFLRESDESGRPVVVHCWSGNGRTGHILAAWLVAARGRDPMQAISTVEATGRKPREAIHAGNATLEELRQLLASCTPQDAV